MASREAVQRISAQSGCLVIVLPCDMEAVVALCRLNGRGRKIDEELTARTGCLVAGTKEQLADARNKLRREDELEHEIHRQFLRHVEDPGSFFRLNYEIGIDPAKGEA